METGNRKSHRIIAPDGQDRGILRIRGENVEVRFVDTSAGGFAVETSEIVAVKRGEILQLQNNAGWHAVSVVLNAPINDGNQIRLKRIGDIIDPQEVDLLSGERFSRTFARRGLVAAAVICAILAGLTGLVVFDHYCRSDKKILPESIDQAGEALSTSARKSGDVVHSDSPRH